eukprot:6190789-Pleurochrysis_carterae.AAC.3
MDSAVNRLRSMSTVYWKRNRRAGLRRPNGAERRDVGTGPKVAWVLLECLKHSAEEVDDNCLLLEMAPRLFTMSD